MSPARRQPVASNHVRGSETGPIDAAGDGWTSPAHPSNHAPDDRGSTQPGSIIRRSSLACRRAFWST
jgi:hypothetical protein